MSNVHHESALLYQQHDHLKAQHKEASWELYEAKARVAAIEAALARIATSLDLVGGAR